MSHRLLRSILEGAAAGLAATVAMTAVMAGGRALGLLGEPPPKKLTGKAMRALGLGRRGPMVDVAATVAHFAFGAGAGALFGATRTFTGRMPAPLSGAMYGALVWAANYAGWLPAVGLMPPPTRDRPGRQPVMLAAHLVYGGVLGSLMHRAEALPAPIATSPVAADSIH